MGTAIMEYDQYIWFTNCKVHIFTTKYMVLFALGRKIYEVKIYQQHL